MQLILGLDFPGVFDLWLIDDDCCDETVFFGANGIGYGQLFFSNGWRWDRIFSPVLQ